MKTRLVTLVTCAALALALCVSYAPAGLWWAIFPACAIAIRFASFRRGWLLGTLFVLGTTTWVIVAAVRHLGLVLIPVAIVLAIFEALPFAFAAWTFALTKNRSALGFCLGAPAVYALLEKARASGPLGVPLAMLGTTQTHGPFAVLYTYGGTPLVSFAVLACCATIVYVAREMRAARFDSRDRAIALAGAIVFVAGLGVSNDVWARALRAREARSFARIGIVEAGPINVGRTFASTARDYAKATNALPKDVDYVLWPEGIFFFTQPDANQQRRVATDAGRAFGRPIFAGATLRENGSLRNVLLEIEPTGSFTSVYRKRRLVPFGEYQPFAFGAGQRASYDATSADEPTLVRAGMSAPFGALICYEVAFDDLTRASANEGAGYLVAVLNDTWFAGTDGPQQLAQLGAARAIESGIPIVRADAVPPSGAVDADGSTIAELRRNGTAVVEMPVGIVTPFRTNGSLPAIVALLIVAFASLAQTVTRAGSRN